MNSSVCQVPVVVHDYGSCPVGQVIFNLLDEGDGVSLRWTMWIWTVWSLHLHVRRREEASSPTRVQFKGPLAVQNTEVQSAEAHNSLRHFSYTLRATHMEVEFT